MSQIKLIGNLRAEKQLIDETSTYIYIGKAVPGTATSAASWQIKRITKSDSTLLWPTKGSPDPGHNKFVHVWDDRATLTYE